MKITKIITKQVQLELINPFVTAALSRTFQNTILLKIETDAGIFGVGESVPTRHVTGETMESALTFIQEISAKLIGEDPLNIEKIYQIMDTHQVNNSAVKAGIDIALYDILGKVMQQPLYKILGGYDNQVQTDITLSIQSPEKMVESAVREYEKGFRILKIKIGLDPKSDIEGIRRIREKLGDKVAIKADANQGYSISDAIFVFDKLLEYDVSGIEQPRPYWDINGTKAVKDKTKMKLVADESVHNHYDAMKFIKADACDMINIKLMKSGGFYKADKINTVCEAAGIPCMIGCMVESRVAITAGAHLAAAKKNIKEADLDGFILTKELDFVQGGFTVDKDIITLLDKPGLGLDIDF